MAVSKEVVGQIPGFSQPNSSKKVVASSLSVLRHVDTQANIGRLGVKYCCSPCELISYGIARKKSYGLIENSYLSFKGT